jgi:Zn-dependent M28 family amino/carboxypeptidase
LPSPTAAEGQTRPPRARPQDQDAPAPIPQFTLAVEHYNRMCRLLKKGIPVRVALELHTSFTEGDGMEHNVLADLPGSDAQIGDEVVMLGAHLDSWQAGTGATDNGCGSAVVMEAMRLLTVLSKESGRSPRRTIRCALWSGEEQGLLGSRAYVRQHFRQEDSAGVTAEHAKFAGYFNLDNGTGRIRGVYLQGNEAVAPIFRAWLKPFHDLDARTLTLNDTGGTDHQAFDAAGLPGFQFIQDPVAYSPRTHHSNMDNWDHASASDLQQAATIMASFAWHCAQRDEKLPRKPMPAPRGQ